MKKWMSVCLLLSVAGVARADNAWAVYGSYWNAGDWGGVPGVGTRLMPELAPYLFLDVKGTWYNELSIQQDAARITANVIPIDVGLLLTTDVMPELALYGGAGVSYYLLSGNVAVGDLSTTSYSTKNIYGGYGLAGFEVTLARDLLEIHASRFTLFAEAFYRYAPVNNLSLDNDLTYDYSGSLGGPGANAGFMLRW